MDLPDYWIPLPPPLAQVARDLGLDPDELKVHQSVNKPALGPSRWLIWMRFRYDPAGLIAQGSSHPMTQLESARYDRRELAQILLRDLSKQVKANGGRTTRNGDKRMKRRRTPKRVRRRHG